MRIRCVIGVLNVSGKPLLERRARAAVRHVNVLRDGFAENRFNFAFRLIGGFLRAFDGNRRGDDRLACRRFYAARLDDWLNRCGQGLLSRRFAGGCFHDRLDRRGDGLLARRRFHAARLNDRVNLRRNAVLFGVFAASQHPRRRALQPCAAEHLSDCLKVVVHGQSIQRAASIWRSSLPPKLLLWLNRSSESASALRLLR